MHYKTVFHEERFNQGVDEKDETGKVYKIKYTLNFLPQFGQHYKFTFRNNLLQDYQLINEGVNLLEAMQN